MINTIGIKQQQLKEGYFKTGSGNELVLIMGSCRAVPYINYLDEWNKRNNNRFTICFIDPFNWNWNINDDRVDYLAELEKQEKNEHLLSMLRSCTIFIHEYYANAGMFNVFKDAEKNIYQFGMKAPIDVCLPNFNDVFILTAEIVNFDVELKKKAIQDYNVIGKLSDQTLQEIDVKRQQNLQRFYDICAKTDFPQFAEVFQDEYKKFRFFHTFNHIAKRFSVTLFAWMCSDFLKINLTDEFIFKINEHDMYANIFTPLTEYDEGYSWNEQVKPLKSIL